jgi:hypothetical protein
MTLVCGFVEANAVRARSCTGSTRFIVGIKMQTGHEIGRLPVKPAEGV